MPDTIQLVLSGDSALAYWSIPEVRKPTPELMLDAHAAKRALATDPALLHHGTVSRALEDQVFSRLPRPLEVLTSNRGIRRTTSNLRIQGLKMSLPAGSLVRTQLPPVQLEGGQQIELLTCSPALVFAQLARRTSELDLALIGDELCGGFARAPLAPHGMVGRPPVATAEEIQAYCRALAYLKGVSTARRVSSYLLNNAKSPREAQLSLFFVMPRCEGGILQAPPLLNRELSVPPEAARALGYHTISPDLGWDVRPTALEYQSRAWHSTVERNEDDAGRMDCYRLMGIDAYSLTPGQFAQFRRMHAVLWSVARSLDAHCRRQSAEELEAMRRLHGQMMAGEQYPRFSDPWQITYR